LRSKRWKWERKGRRSRTERAKGQEKPALLTAASVIIKIYHNDCSRSSRSRRRRRRRRRKRKWRRGNTRGPRSRRSKIKEDGRRGGKKDRAEGKGLKRS